MTNRKDTTFGPFTYPETRKFVGQVVGQSDSKNDRFDLDFAAEELANRAFDEDTLWQHLEASKVQKKNKDTYRASVQKAL